MSSSGDDCFPLSMVSDVCEVQMQLRYEEKNADCYISKRKLN